MKDTHSVGNISTGRVLAALMSTGKKVLLPFGDGHPYDLVFEHWDKSLKKVQCKTGKLKNGVIHFHNYSSLKTGDKTYVGLVDYFGVFCPQNNKCYLVPIEDCTKTVTMLRINKPKNGHVKRIRYAATYEIAEVA